MIDRLTFAAPFIYSPRGTSAVAIRSRQLRDRIKAGDRELLPLIARRVAELVAAGQFPNFFGPEVTLVPVPGRAPQVTGGLWVPDLIAQALRNAGLAREVWPALQRISAVPKSAWAAPGERPDVQHHLASLAMTDHLPPSGHLVLVDDFVTKGRTLLAAATKLEEALPGIDIKAFACVRTMGLVPDIDRVRDPVVGVIQEIHGDASRQP